MLYNFLVLGYVPGTNIQLSFQAILALFTIVIGSLSLGWIEWQHRHLTACTVELLRMPLHASQLHLRVR